MKIGKFPILFVAVNQEITTKENSEIDALHGMCLVDEAKKSQYDILLQKAKTVLPIAARVPIVIDGEIIKIIPTSRSQNMNMDTELNGKDGSQKLSPSRNITTISFQTSADSMAGRLLDLLFALSDVIYSGKGRAPNVSYFGDGVSIPNGYITGLAMNSDAATNIVNVSMTISRDMSLRVGDKINEKPTEAAHKLTSQSPTSPISQNPTATGN